MTGLGPGPAPPILRGHPQNFVFMITQPTNLLTNLPTYLPLSARRLINTALYRARLNLPHRELLQHETKINQRQYQRNTTQRNKTEHKQAGKQAIKRTTERKL